jgi:hypothetical protein
MKAKPRGPAGVPVGHDVAVADRAPVGAEGGLESVLDRVPGQVADVESFAHWLSVFERARELGMLDEVGLPCWVEMERPVPPTSGPEHHCEDFSFMG